MDNGIEHIVDLGLVNYTKHPTNPNFVVFRFKNSQKSVSFENELKNLNISFEKATEERNGSIYYLFALHKSDFKKAQKINYAVEANHRNFIISNKFLRWLLILFFLGITTLAIVGYFSSPEVLQREFLKKEYIDSVRRTNN